MASDIGNTIDLFGDSLPLEDDNNGKITGKRNGKRNGKKNGKSVTAEKLVPTELEVELDIRKWKEQTQYMGKWHDSVHFGDNLLSLAQMPDETVDLILTDPPYAINYASNRRKKSPKYKKLKNDNSVDWIPKFAEQAYRVLKNDRHIYCFCRHDTYPDFLKALTDVGFKIKRTLIWVKNNHGSGDLKGDYAPQDEWIIYAHKGRRELFGKRHSNVLFYNKVMGKNQNHSTEKPVELLKFLIGKSTEEGELVLDPYGGSGSTMHAAIEMERHYCVMELDESYYYTIAEREKDLKQNHFIDQMYGLKHEVNA